MARGISEDEVDIQEHMNVAQLLHGDLHINEHVACYFHLLEIESNKEVIEDVDVVALWFVRELLTLFWVGHKANVNELCLVFARLPLDGVIPHLEELLLHLRLGGDTEFGILGHVGLEPA